MGSTGEWFRDIEDRRLSLSPRDLKLRQGSPFWLTMSPLLHHDDNNDQSNHESMPNTSDSTESGSIIDRQYVSLDYVLPSISSLCIDGGPQSCQIDVILFSPPSHGDDQWDLGGSGSSHSSSSSPPVDQQDGDREHGEGNDSRTSLPMVIQKVGH